MDKNTNLPVEVKRNLPIEQKRENKRTINGIKRIGKVALNLGIALSGGILTSVVSGPIAGVIGTGLWMYGGVNAGINAIYNKQKDSMFITNRNLRGELTLSQDSTNIRAFTKLRGLAPQEKAAVMGLEMLVGLQNYQQQYEDQGRKKAPAENSDNNVYGQVFRTVTHSLNIKTMEALEKLGYIQIEKNEPTNRKSTLLFERLEFKQYKEVKEILKAAVTFDREGIKQYQKQMNEIKFRITDKPLDLDEIYEQYLDVKDTRGNNPMRKPIRRIGILLDALKNKNIDVQTDEIGKKKINYNAEKPFAKRLEELHNISSGKAFKESLQVKEFQEQETIGQEVLREPIKGVEQSNDTNIER